MEWKIREDEVRIEQVTIIEPGGENLIFTRPVRSSVYVTATCDTVVLRKERACHIN